MGAAINPQRRYSLPVFTDGHPDPIVTPLSIAAYCTGRQPAIQRGPVGLLNVLLLFPDLDLILRLRQCPAKAVQQAFCLSMQQLERAELLTLR